MTWTQLTLRLPGGIELTLVSAFRPRKPLPSLPPEPRVVEAEGRTLSDNVIAFPRKVA